MITPKRLLDAHNAATAAKPKPTRAIRSSGLPHCFKEERDKREPCVLAMQNETV